LVFGHKFPENYRKYINSKEVITRGIPGGRINIQYIIGKASINYAGMGYFLLFTKDEIYLRIIIKSVFQNVFITEYLIFLFR